MNVGFVENTYGDGDKVLLNTEWRRKLQNELCNFDKKDLEVDRKNRNEITEDEIALKHPTQNSIVKMCDNGNINLFVNEDTGILIDKNSNSVFIYGENIHLVSKETGIHSKAHGFSWNNKNFNPKTYESQSGIFIDKQRDSFVDEELKNLIERVGIER